jgi:predicted nucleic acid-binding protein
VIVVDCAAVVDALTVVDGTADLRATLAAHELHAPALLDYELVSALRGLTLRRGIGVARAQDAMTDFEDLRIHRWHAGDALRRRAFGLRDRLSAHDAAYVALAEALDCDLVTRDARLARSGGHLARIAVV